MMDFNASDEYECAELSDDPFHTDVFLVYLQDVTACQTQVSCLASLACADDEAALAASASA